MTDIERTPLVLYHGSCFDGFGSAWAFKYFWKGGPVEYVGVHYGQDPPDCSGRHVWLLDFTYKRDVLIEKVIIPSKRTVIYDHHVTAQKDLEGIDKDLWDRGLQRNDKIVFDMHRSGAGITWDELEREHGIKVGYHIPRYNGERKERLIDYLEDRDIWKFKLDRSKDISAYTTTVPFTFEAYDQLAHDLNGEKTRNYIADKGATVLRYIDMYGDKACDTARFEMIGGFKVPTMTLPYMNCSEHVNKLAEKHPDAAFAAGYFRRNDGMWQFSLRSIGDFDVSKVALSYGGGGHKNAAGFQRTCLPWMEEHVGEAQPYEAKGKVTEIKLSETLTAEVEDHPKDEEVSFD